MSSIRPDTSLPASPNSPPSYLPGPVGMGGCTPALACFPPSPFSATLPGGSHAAGAGDQLVLQMVRERTQVHSEARLHYESQAAHLVPVLEGRPPSTQLFSKECFRPAGCFHAVIWWN